jgi:hypothetical protein
MGAIAGGAVGGILGAAGFEYGADQITEAYEFDGICDACYEHDDNKFIW